MWRGYIRPASMVMEPRQIVLQFAGLEPGRLKSRASRIETRPSIGTGRWNRGPSLDQHPQVTIRLVPGHGTAGWSRSSRTVTVLMRTRPARGADARASMRG